MKLLTAAISLASVSVNASTLGTELPIGRGLEALVAPSSTELDDIEDGAYVGPIGFRNEAFPERVNLIVINGFDTPAPRVHRMALVASEGFGSPAAFIFNDLVIDDDDWFSSAITFVEKGIAATIEKLGDYDWSVNEATNTLVDKLEDCLTANQNVHLIAHSAGALCVLNAVREIEESAELRERLCRVHVLTVGSAVFEEGHILGAGWPAGLGSLHHLVDARDPVVQLAGLVSWGEGDLKYHDFIMHYSRYFTGVMLEQSGTTIITETSEAP
jgi:hypothetical protein